MKAWIVVVVTALALVACKKGKREAPAVVPGAPAGDVLDVTGTVTASRGQDIRTLKAGDEVSGDDLITTAPDASVVIELRHNHVKWSLKGGYSKVLGESAAWRAAKQGDPSASLGERTTAAGRHAEREAADTAAAQAPAPSPGAPALMARTAPTFGVEVQGALTREQVQAVLAAISEQLAGCGPISFAIVADGKVSIDPSAPCAAVLQGLAFPTAQVETKVTLTISAP